jgi:hypothetical protein
MENSKKNSNYWGDIDSSLNSLLSHGYVKLPSLQAFDLDTIANRIKNEMNGETFAELTSSHKVFLDELDFDQFLTPKLYSMAKKIFGYKGKKSNQYHIARLVEPGNSKEMFRAHFDSHLFTMVLPIKIPKAKNGGTVGDLIYFPHARKCPTNEIHNFFGKLSHKRFASKKGMQTFAKKHHQIIDDFKDYSPLLFIGNTTLHTNKQVSLDCSGSRLTLLAHFFDPSPNFSIGKVFRTLRNR